jgi:hypothetical protein
MDEESTSMKRNLFQKKFLPVLLQKAQCQVFDPAHLIVTQMKQPLCKLKDP